jgi:hypothetical protein
MVLHFVLISFFFSSELMIAFGWSCLYFEFELLELSGLLILHSTMHDIPLSYDISATGVFHNFQPLFSFFSRF